MGIDVKLLEEKGIELIEELKVKKERTKPLFIPNNPNLEIIDRRIAKKFFDGDINIVSRLKYRETWQYNLCVNNIKIYGD